MDFPVVMYGCESWTKKKAEHGRTDVFELWCWRRLESPLKCKEIQPVNPKGSKSWIFIGRVDAEAPLLWPPDVKNWLSGKGPDAGKNWRQEMGTTTEDEMPGGHYQLDGHESEQVPGVGDGQGGQVCLSLWGSKESDTTKWLNWTDTYMDNVLYTYMYYIYVIESLAIHLKLTQHLKLTICQFLKVPTGNCWQRLPLSLEIRQRNKYNDFNTIRLFN